MKRRHKKRLQNKICFKKRRHWKEYLDTNHFDKEKALKEFDALYNNISI